ERRAGPPPGGPRLIFTLTRATRLCAFAPRPMTLSFEALHMPSLARFPAARITALAALLCSLILPFTAHAATRVEGTVTDAHTHQAISGAAVSADGANARATTDENGRFALSAEKDFSAIVVSRIGYRKQTVPVTGASLAIELEPEAVEMGTFDVTGRAIAKP